MLRWLPLLGLVGCASLPIETGKVDLGAGPNPPATTAEVSPPASTAFDIDFSPPPDAMQPGKHYVARLTTEREQSPTLVHGQFVRFEGDVTDRVAIFRDCVVEDPRFHPAPPILAKVPHVNRLFRSTAAPQTIPVEGEKSIPLATIDKVTQVAAENALRAEVSNESLGNGVATTKLLVKRGHDVLQERIGVDFDGNEASH